jgi:hypothetical protein
MREIQRTKEENPKEGRKEKPPPLQEYNVNNNLSSVRPHFHEKGAPSMGFDVLGKIIIETFLRTCILKADF